MPDRPQLDGAEPRNPRAGRGRHAEPATGVREVALQVGRYGSLAFAASVVAAVTAGTGVAAAESTDSASTASTSGASSDASAPSSSGGSDSAKADTTKSETPPSSPAQKDGDEPSDSSDPDGSTKEGSGSDHSISDDPVSDDSPEGEDPGSESLVDRDHVAAQDHTPRSLESDHPSSVEDASDLFPDNDVDGDPTAANANSGGDSESDDASPPAVPVPASVALSSADHSEKATRSGEEQASVVVPATYVSAAVNSSGLTGRSSVPVVDQITAALMAWVRRTFLNESPNLAYDPNKNVQGQFGVITGDIGATDPEGDKIRYVIVKGPQHGTVVVDQATGVFTYHPDLDFAQAGGSDGFVVRITDDKFSLLDLFRADHGSPQTTIALNVDSIVPSAERFIVPLPDNIKQPQNAVFTSDGKGLVFRGTPDGTTRSEIFRSNLDGTDVQCLTCGLSPELTAGFSKPFVFEDGNRILVSSGTQSSTGGETADHYILECAGGVYSSGPGTRLVKINVPTTVAPGVTVVQKERELRIAPDGVHVAYTQLLGAGTVTQIVSSVGTLQRTEAGYDIVDAHIVYAGGELKNFTPDGKGVIVTDFFGRYEAGNADDVLIDLSDGTVTRLTTNLDYDESVDLSPNGQWMAVGSSRGLDYLTPMSQVVRPTFVPAWVVFPTFQAKKGTLNQAWVVSRDAETAGEEGIFLGDATGQYVSVPVANWSPDGTQVAFWERNSLDATDTRLVLATLKNIDGGVTPADVSTPDTSSWATPVSQYVPKPTPLEPSRDGKVGGHATVTTTKVGNTTTTSVTYTNFEDEEGFILNGTESTASNASGTSIIYNANISVSGSDGSDRGYLTADNVKILNQATITGVIESSIDGDYQVMGTPVG